MRDIKQNWLFWLILVTIIAIVIRSLPAWTNAAWGNDFGIYYGITNSIIESQQIFVEYSGWGGSYQYFPILYLITAAFHTFTGMDVFWLMPKIAPIIGGLTIPLLYFIVLELVKKRRVALLSAAFLAVTPFHVYPTSHAAPLTVGHFFMLLSLYLFIKYLDKKKLIVPLILSTILLVFSHHLTTYFYIIAISLMFLINLSRKKIINKDSFFHLTYVSFVAAFSFTYWAFVATPVFFRFMPGGIPILPIQIVLLYYILLFSGFFAILFTTKYRIIRFDNTLKQYSSPSLPITFTCSFLIMCAMVCFFIFRFGVSGGTLRLSPLIFFYSLPILLLLSLSIAGLSILKKSNGGVLVIGWLSAVALSLLYSLFYRETSLYSDRHLEYLIIPLCIAAAIAVIELLKDVDFKKLLSFKNLFPKMNYHHSKHFFTFVFVVGIGLSNVVVVYPGYDAFNIVDERVSQPCINSLEWMDGNISTNNVIASDHRLSMLLWAKGFNITMEPTNLTWVAENWTLCLGEMQEYNISYILIDDIMKERVTNIEVGKYYYMTNESYGKFSRAPFELVYRNSTLDNNREELHWIELYKVNWTSITKHSYYFGCDGIE